MNDTCYANNGMSPWEKLHTPKCHVKSGCPLNERRLLRKTLHVTMGEEVILPSIMGGSVPANLKLDPISWDISGTRCSPNYYYYYYYYYCYYYYYLYYYYSYYYYNHHRY
ncbi:hypothetical protein DPMN_099029 [Dreissena polymorpha]|uniref:Uncharacterized protein n=1 Tax=Dreissena polymorpha TaxID=45954 RepID=A0A9D4R619_DREPO|nr:hypothetical protein DPMN_099029 [Dreissena polymorpha]